MRRLFSVRAVPRFLSHKASHTPIRFYGKQWGFDEKESKQKHVEKQEPKVEESVDEEVEALPLSQEEIDEKLRGPELRTDEEYEYGDYDKNINKGQEPSKLSNLTMFNDYDIGDCYSYFVHQTVQTQNVDAALKMSTDMIETTEKLENDLEPLPRKLIGLLCRGLINHLLLNEQDQACNDFESMISAIEEDRNKVPEKLLALAYGCKAFSISASIIEHTNSDVPKKFKTLEALNASLDIAPEFDGVRFKRILQVNRSNFSQSLNDCDILIKNNKDPWAAFGLYHRAVLRLASDKSGDPMNVYKMAVKDLLKCLEKKPDMLEAVRDLSSIYVTLGDQANGVKYLDMLIDGLRKKDIPAASAIFSRAMLRISANDVEQGFKDLDEAFTLEPSFVEVYQKMTSDSFSEVANNLTREQ